MSSWVRICIKSDSVGPTALPELKMNRAMLIFDIPGSIVPLGASSVATCTVPTQTW